MSTLVVEHVTAGYDPEIDVLRNISLSVDEKETVSLIGANGAGKSTLLIMISGLLHPKTGRIVYQNERIEHLEPHEVVGRGIVQVLEERETFDSLTVEENLTIACQTKRSKTKKVENLNFSFETFPILYERRYQLARTLSGGEQKMLAVGKAFMAEPKMLLLDDISMGLAPKIVVTIYEQLRKYIKLRQIPVLLVEQNVDIALEFAERGYVISGGEIVISGKSSELKETEEVKVSYLGA